MQIKRYLAEDMRQALKQVREEQGPDAVILSTRQLAEGLEVVAALDYDASLFNPAPEAQAAPSPSGQGLKAGAETAGSAAASSAAGAASESFAYRPSPQTGETAPAPGDDDSLAAMRREIKALRRMLECQLSSLAFNDFSRRSPVRADLLARLIHLGLSSPLAQDLVARVPAEERDPARAWQHALSDLCRMLPVDNKDPLAQGGVLSLVGPTGVGKTTAIARLAVRYAELHGPERVAMISADSKRPGAQECLFSCGRQLNIPVYLAADADEVHERLARLAHVPVVLVDTAGGLRDDPHAHRVSGLLRPGGRPMTRWLVLAANAQLQTLEEALMLYSNLPLSGIIATKLDETASLGGLLSVIARNDVPLTLVSDSPDLRRPLQSVSGRQLLKRAVAQLRASPPRRMDRESLAQHVGELHYALG